MYDDLVFHITTKEEFNNQKRNNKYYPESLTSKGFIHCSKGSQIERTANHHFAGRQEVLLLVIDVSTLCSDIKYEVDEETGEKFPHIYGPLNTDAIMDKLNIFAESDGTFNIAFSSKS
ncbi:DUF952 domain-containing protein [Fodinibius sediminis]|uniref:Uncharacterized conserved protein, DUF952 family n=1 Tax=Fodinibius sediminis TaxID=1214077 RepID=A0A521F2N2_9BACT|nr:DUF952 domain-containing protein [Fodinibius sediminis]SMO90458.1 Uncharacterized conserved protein, DUF952 family [Fodinibius sediminis]